MPEKFNFNLPPLHPEENEKPIDTAPESAEIGVVDEYSEEKINKIGFGPGEFQNLLATYLKHNAEALTPDAQEKLKRIIDQSKQEEN
ncbi:MAG TPA: hypothetical protein PK950_02400 [Candidatus Paceibacterota bacterium]|nr:hypothetical protein [Candidatus Paceibacterota bacterium]